VAGICYGVYLKCFLFLNGSAPLAAGGDSAVSPAGAAAGADSLNLLASRSILATAVAAPSALRTEDSETSQTLVTTRLRRDVSVISGNGMITVKCQLFVLRTVLRF
jgi:hypothetical protein